MSLTPIFVGAGAIDFTLPFRDDALIFATVLMLLLLVPLLSRKARVPEVVGLILVGILVGEHAFGLLVREGAIQLLGKVGLLYIMFLAGLEIDIDGFMKQRNRSLVFGGLTFMIPMLIGTTLAYTILDFNLPSSVLLASMFASHTLLSYPAISKLGLSQNSAVTTALGGTIITDTAALMVLAVIASMTTGDVDTMFWVKLGVSVVVYSGVMLFGLPKLGRLVFRTLGDDGVMQYIFVLAAVFASAVLATVAQLEDIIGAFFAGLALNRLIPHRSPLMNRIEFVGNALFIPLFLVSVGMIVNWRALFFDTDESTVFETWKVASVMVVCVLGTKYLAADATRRIFRYSKAEGNVIFGLTVAQAAATLAAVFVGYNLQLFDGSVLNGTIIMILVTCVVSPLVSDRFGREVARHEAEEVKPGGDDVPQRILVPLANPATTEQLMNVAVLLHNPKSGQPLYPLTVAMDDEQVKERVAQGEKNLAAAVTFAAAASRAVVPVTRVDHNIANGIIRALVELRIRTVVIGWNGQVSTRDRVFGSVLDKLLEQSQQTVFVYRHQQPTTQHQRVLLAIPPFSARQPGFLPAVSEINTLTQQLGATLHVYTPRDSKAALSRALAEVKPNVTPHWVEMANWDWLLQDLARTSTPGDLFIIMAARAGSIAASPDLEKLPRQLAPRFPENSFMIVYPSIEDATVSASEAGLARRAMLRMAEEGGQPVALKGLVAAAVYPELAHALAGETDASTIVTVLKESARSSSIRILRGVVLLDAHDPRVSADGLVLGTSDEGITFDSVSEPVHRVWVLLSGGAVSADEHLQRLTYLTQKLRVVPDEVILAARSLDDVAAILDSDNTH